MVNVMIKFTPIQRVSMFCFYFPWLRKCYLVSFSPGAFRRTSLSLRLISFLRPLNRLVIPCILVADPSLLSYCGTFLVMLHPLFSSRVLTVSLLPFDFLYRLFMVYAVLLHHILVFVIPCLFAFDDVLWRCIYMPVKDVYNCLLLRYIPSLFNVGDPLN